MSNHLFLNPVQETEFQAAKEGATPLVGRLGAKLAALYEMAKRAGANVNMRNELADLDEATLRDIGIAQDEIYLIRRRERFTPRAWNKTAA